MTPHKATRNALVFTGAAVFDGATLHPDTALRVVDGYVAGLGQEVRLDAGISRPASGGPAS